MKKYLILTSVFALAACGGGGHSGSGTPTRAAVTQGAIDSNSYITSMASEVLIPKSGSGAVITRSGSVNYNGETYTSYRLDDVNFRVATGANDAFLRFNMDENGKIDSLVMNVGTPEAMSDQHMVRRSDDKADFRGIVYEYVVLDDSATQHDDIFKQNRDTKVRLVLSPAEDEKSTYSMLSNAAAGKCPEGKFCRWDRIDQAFRVTSSGSEDSFKYSDFGKLQTTNFGKYKGVTAENFADAKAHTRKTDGGLEVIGNYETWADITDGDFDDDFEVFAGGYNVAALQHRPTEDMHFTGKAIGSLYATDSVSHDDAGVLLTDNNATLDFVGGTETLTMNFNNSDSKWYKVTVTKEADETNNITFNNFHASGNPEYKFRTDSGSGISVDNFTTAVGSVDNSGGVKTEGLLDMGYYGVAGPEEATGMVRFKETANESDTIYEREFRAGYGMKPGE